MLSTVDSTYGEIVSPTAGGVSPLAAVIADNLLGDEGNRISHVLLLTLDSVESDVVKTQTLLGSAGRIGYLSVATGTWKLAVDGKVEAAGVESACASVLWKLDRGVVTTKSVAEFRAPDDEPIQRFPWQRDAVAITPRWWEKLVLTLLVIGGIGAVGVGVVLLFGWLLPLVF